MRRKGAISMFAVVLIALGLLGAGYMATNYGNMHFQAVGNILGKGETAQEQIYINKTGVVVKKFKDLKAYGKIGNTDITPILNEGHFKIYDGSGNLLMENFEPYRLKAKKTYKVKWEKENFLPFEKEIYVPSVGRVEFKAIPIRIPNTENDVLTKAVGDGASFMLCNDINCEDVAGTYSSGFSEIFDEDTLTLTEKFYVCDTLEGANYLAVRTGYITIDNAGVSESSTEMKLFAVVRPTLKVVENSGFSFTQLVYEHRSDDDGDNLDEQGVFDFVLTSGETEEAKQGVYFVYNYDGMSEEEKAIVKQTYGFSDNVQVVITDNGRYFDAYAQIVFTPDEYTNMPDNAYILVKIDDLNGEDGKGNIPVYIRFVKDPTLCGDSGSEGGSEEEG